MKRLFTVFASLLTQGAKVQKTKTMYVVMALVMMALAPQGVRAIEYDFKAQSNSSDHDVQVSTSTVPGYSNYYYFTKIGSISDAGRFATGPNYNWCLYANNQSRQGLENLAGGGRYFMITQLQKGEVVTIESSASISLESTDVCTTVGTQSYRMKQDGELIISAAKNVKITKITIEYQATQNRYDYDPAIESYDLYWVPKNTTFTTTDADFPLNTTDLPAKILTLSSSSGLSLNNRIAISEEFYNGHLWTTTELWTFSRDGDGNESQGLKVNYGWHNLSICNLKEGDRVRITFSGTATFSSKGQNSAYNGCSAFKDTNNNGEFLIEEDDREVSCGLPVEGTSNYGVTTSYFYTITEDGHLDIALFENSRLCKVEIYGDHQARMVDRDNEFNSKTSYFDTTGQLEAKHHIVPGGLHVYIGNDNDTQHAEVVSSDKGPVSFVYDEQHYKMARHGNVNVWDRLPSTGTFYKFVPEVSGKMWVKFKAVSVNYSHYNDGVPGNGADQFGKLNESTTNASCPYYLMVEENGSFQEVANYYTKQDEQDPNNYTNYYTNGENGYFGSSNGNPGQNDGITVERGKTYYLYGWWEYGTDGNALTNHSCGVAELIEVTFRANQSITPLAKWVESGTTTDDDLATVNGYTTVCVKKKSDNIASCTAIIEDGKLKISNITFVDKNKGGGTILLKIGNPNNDGDPVFAYTIAYNAGYNEQVVGQAGGKDMKRSEGHTWNFSDYPLNGLKWNNKNAEADITPFGTHFNNFATAEKDENGIPTNGTNNSLLSEEITKGDWTFNYRVKKNGQFHDPRFLNNWDMEGDNADMMWDTEGLIINAGSSQSCIFNEHGVSIDHTNKTQADPDRYVGFLEGGEFIIPKLMKDDRVIIYMGSGEGSGNEAMEFHITNALDALHNPIDPNDSYHAGGSQWNVPNGHNDPYYRGCYHFYATGDQREGHEGEPADMKFTMSGGSMCKLYSIKIYRGEREETNAVQETGGGYTLLAVKDQEGDVTSTETKSWNLHHRGKGETVADGTGKFHQVNEVLAHSGNITNLTLDSYGTSGITYTNQGEIGVLRVRVKCMEYNHNYVTDFSDRNFTLALHETKSYPYTWDFTDMIKNDADKGYFSGQDIEDEYDNYPETTVTYDTKGYDISIWDENGGMILHGPTWGYQNQNMLFENSKGINGNQLYANDKVIPETKGLWFYFDNNDAAYNGCMQITSDGLKLCNTPDYVNDSRKGWWNYKMVIPNVPSGAAVYLRVKDLGIDKDYESTNSDGTKAKFFYKSYKFGSNAKTDIGSDNNSKLYDALDNSGDQIMAIYNAGDAADLTLTLNGWLIKKMSVSQDFKKVNIRGWATESRGRVIDPELTAYLTGYDFETCLVTGVNYTNKKITLKRVYPSEDNTNYVMSSLDDGDTGASIIHNRAATTLTATNGEVKIFNLGTATNPNEGFHLFVPDMHDYYLDEENKPAGLKSLSGNSSMLVARVTPTTSNDKIPGIEGDYTNYALTYKYLRKSDGIIADDEELNDGAEAFYRIATNGASSSGNQGYLPLLTNPETPSGSGNSHAKFSIIFEEEFENINPGITTTIDDIESSGRVVTSEGFYNLNGQKMNGIPTQKGMYIVNGKKVLVK